MTEKRAASKRPARKASAKVPPEDKSAAQHGPVMVVSAVGNLIREAQDEQKKKDD